MYFEINSNRGIEIAEASSKEELEFYIRRTHKEIYGSLQPPYHVRIITKEKVDYYKQLGLPLQAAYRQ